MRRDPRAKRPRRPSDWVCFPYTDSCFRGSNGVEREAGCFQQGAKLGFGAFLAAGEGEQA
jgi:hypothetical protein